MKLSWLYCALATSFLTLAFFSTPVLAQERAEASAESGEEEASDDDSGRFRRIVVVDTVKWEPAEGKLVSLVYSNQLKITEPDFANIESTKVGDVIVLTQCAAPKLKTDVDLQFGDVLVKAGNVAENYPGVYGLWLRKTEDGWNLVFNWKADVWGTMHDPKADVAEIPLAYTHDVQDAAAVATILVAEEKSKDVPRFKATFTEENGVVKVDMEWGSHHWSTSFKAA